MQIRLNAKDSNIFTLGFGPNSSGDTYGPPTSAKSLYELFYPRGTYFQYSNGQSYNGTDTGKATYLYFHSDGTTGYADHPNVRVNIFPGQMEAFADLYKYARVERVDFLFKITNLGVSPVDPSKTVVSSNVVPSALLDSPLVRSATITHTTSVLPNSQLTDQGTNWLYDSKKSDTFASQVAEIPGASAVTSSQDGNKETVFIRRSIDLTQRMAGDSVRQRTWMTSQKDVVSGTTTKWAMPAIAAEDPVLSNIGTSPIIDERLQTIGPIVLNQDNNLWFRYNEQVSIQWHITFWEPKTQPITFS